MENRPQKKEKRRPGRKPGSKARHGGYSLMMRGVLPERRRYIGLYLTAVREGLVHDLAAKEEDLSTAQRVLIDRVITFLGVARLIEEHARERGILDSRGRLSQGLTGHYLSFNRFIKETMALLGLEKRSLEPEATFAEIVKRYDRQDAEGATAQAKEGQQGGHLSSRIKKVQAKGQDQAEDSSDQEGGKAKQIDPGACGEEKTGQGEGGGPDEDEQA